MISPIVVGGLGGSGTRVVANILSINDVFLGNDLNNSMDYLIFSRLFIRPTWLKSVSDSSIKKRLELLKKYTLGLGLSDHEIEMILKLNISYPRFKTNKSTLLHRYEENKNRATKRWGWKEPNSHIFLRQLLEHFEKMKYIYVVRNGLDMITSKNKQQLHNWGNHFNIPINENLSEEHRQGLFWLKSNNKIKHLKTVFGEDKIYVLDYDLLCADTKQELTKLFSFLKISLGKKQLDISASSIKPTSRNRHLQAGGLDISADLMERIQRFTF